jgi:flagellar hook assembly protein FlgD
VYYYKIDAADAGGNTASSPQGLIMVSRQLPVAIMDTPSDNQMFRCGSTINIMGTASDATSFKNYTIDYGAGENPSSWANLKTSTTATTNGLLYTWNTSSLTGYTYTVRLTVTNNSNNVATETSMVRFLCIQNVAVSESYISPNGDRVKDSTNLSATFTQPSDWTLAIKGLLGSAVRTFTGSATSISQTWDGRDNNGTIVSDGTYTYQLDAIGTGTTTSAAPKTGPIVVDAVISNVGISSNTINTQADETSTVFFTITSQATVTFSIIPEKQGSAGTPVYQTGKVCLAACSFTWDGKDNTGKVVPDEAYLFVLTVSNGAHTGGYSPMALIGTGTVSCSQSSGFDPISNQPMTITYTPAQPSRVNLNISWGSQNFKILDSFPILSGSNDFIWDGRNQTNKPLDLGAKASCTVASLLRENVIITTGDAVRISELKTDPYNIHFSYGQFTRIKYTLSRGANVTIKLTSPSGAVLTVVNSQPQTAGPQEVEWNGLASADATAKNELVSEEGDYMVTVQAVNPATGTSSITKANARIGY